MERTVLTETAIRIKGDYKLGVADLDISEIAHETVSVQGGQGAIDVPLSRKKPINITVNSSDIHPEVLQTLGICDASGDVTAHAIVKDIVACTKKQHVLEIRGSWVSFNPSSIKSGETKHSYKISVRKLKWTIDGQVVINYDALSVTDENKKLLGF